MTSSPPDLVLVVEDDPPQRDQLVGFLRDLGLEVIECSSVGAALRQMETRNVDLVLTDLRLPGRSGAELLEVVRELNPEVPVVLMTAYGTVRNAVACLQAGARDYLLKPLDLDEIEHVVRHSLETRHLRRENRELRRRLGAVETLDGIITSGGEMSLVLSEVARVARSRVPVLILGESGTGKELIARAIHAASSRRDGPFVAVNAAALAPTLLESELFGHERGAFTGADRSHPGRFEAASGGTLFFDEIGDLPTEIQIKILRVLQERSVERVGSNTPIPVDVRIVSATHEDLPAKVEQGTFRDDLFYRLAVVSLSVPPLRARRSDIPRLVEHFLEKYSDLVDDPPSGISREALDSLLRYEFPGNVRELENIVQRAMVLARSDTISRPDLPPTILTDLPDESAKVDCGETLPERVEALERSMLRTALDAEDGHQSNAAERLGISERMLRYKLSKYPEIRESQQNRP